MTPNRLRRLRHDERGMSLVFVGLGLMAFLAATTLAVDVGMLMTARTQAQSSADAGALAGATALAFNDFDDRSAGGPAVESAVNASLANQVIGAPVAVTPADVTFLDDPSGVSDRVRVQVYRTADRRNAVPTLMAQLFGINQADITAIAVAEASPANAETCVKPFMIPDKWRESQTPPWDPTDTFDMFDKKGNLLPNADVYNPIGSADYTGYTARDTGLELVLRAGTGDNIEPTMYYSWSMPSAIGGDYYRDNISGCNQTIIPLAGDYYMTQEPGDMTGPTDQGIDDLIARDPDAYWDTSCNCVKGSAFGGVSPRVTPIPLYDPVYYAEGKKNGRNASFKLANIMGFFIERRVGNQVYGRVMPIGGIIDRNAGPAPAGAFPVAIRLVQ